MSPHIDREKSESDIMEHVFSDVLTHEERGDEAYPFVEVAINRGFVASTRSATQVDVLSEPSDPSLAEH